MIDDKMPKAHRDTVDAIRSRYTSQHYGSDDAVADVSTLLTLLNEYADQAMHDRSDGNAYIELSRCLTTRVLELEKKVVEQRNTIDDLGAAVNKKAWWRF